jgi:nucleotidyltransferase/DNA polymerase involved in DNA repair
MDRSIVHMDLDSFFVSVERKLDLSLIGKPVLVDGSSGRAQHGGTVKQSARGVTLSVVEGRLSNQLN